ncbi:MAG: hypothetical protein UV73_C0003G0028 [Candidatus Gottesmanbacteria bacterium GW2011_GWA2_43_14]|uniref:Uncharacterized protein n=1 Tax=Candidatus Gottesmanbacteria bacterium GW2011_GWA2_43_14 TaxID=1618443 RepID=A0A0G1FSV7_9BACT|nr:MAG: hypothetical protein UV73_C0003G0028 [Candidatus Gottesmanbacteria bacterium GW2011_GWA2_43_14]
MHSIAIFYRVFLKQLNEYIKEENIFSSPSLGLI